MGKCEHFDAICKCYKHTRKNGALLTLRNYFVLTLLGVSLFHGASLPSITATISILLLQVDHRGDMLLDEPVLLIASSLRLDLRLFNLPWLLELCATAPQDVVLYETCSMTYYDTPNSPRGRLVAIPIRMLP